MAHESMKPRIVKIAWALPILLVATTTAQAQPAPDRPRTPSDAPRPTPDTTAPRPLPETTAPRPPAAPKPWHKGVSPANKTKALSLYNVGNSYFAKSQWSAALREYAAAIKLWDHPGIRYNMAKCLMELKRYLEAYRSLKLALRFGAAPLDPPRLFKEGTFLLGVLNRLLARVRIVCRQPGVRVTLDGHALFTGPGEATRLMDPAKRHLVMATKHKHITQTRSLALLPGRVTTVTLKLMRVKKNYVMKRRFKTFIPWVVLGAGLVVAALGTPFVLQAIKEFDVYDRRFDAWCQDAQGCAPSDRPASLVKQYDKGALNYGVAIAFFALGGAGIAAAVTLVILNMPRAVRVEGPRRAKPRVSVLPTIGPGSGSLTLTMRF